MALGSLFTVIALFVLVLAAAGAGFFFYSRGRGGDLPGFFAPRLRRLAFIERAYLDGGRKLLLVRRDNVEHLILIGGPIDLVVETGIQAVASPAAAPAKDEYSYTEAVPWPHNEESLTPGKAPELGKRNFLAAARDAVLAAGKTKEPAEPRLSVPQGAGKDGSDTLELTPLQETKAAQ
jgi:flagellar protein FliO/FliZ